MSNRQSMYPQPTQASYWTLLDNCSQSLYVSGRALEAAKTTLDQGTYDFKRISKIIATRRCFEVVTESEVQSAQRGLHQEIEPQLKELIARAEEGLEAFKKRDRALLTKIEARAQLPTRNAVVPNIKALERKLQTRKERLAALGRRSEGLEQDLMAA